MRDILFIFPPALNNPGLFKYHLGSAYLQAILENENILSAQYVCNESKNIIETTKSIFEYSPKIVGFTVYDSNFGISLKLAKSIKDYDSNTHIIFGGPTTTFSADYILNKHPQVDFCVHGEAESRIKDIVSVLLSNPVNPREGLSSIPGISWSYNGHIHSTGGIPLAEVNADANLDDLPSPYLTGILHDGEPGLLTGRGCNQKCIFCSFAVLGGNRLRVHSIERVLEELDYIEHQMATNGKNGIISIYDDTFTLVPSRVSAICEEIIKRGIKLDLSCITRADKVDKELLTLMKNAGFGTIAFGLESSSPRVLRAIGKVRPPDFDDPDLFPEIDFVNKMRQNVNIANDLGFNVTISIILGLPSETEKDAIETLRFVDKLPIKTYMHNILKVFPGTPLWDIKDDYKIKTKLDTLGLPITYGYEYDPFMIAANNNASERFKIKHIKLASIEALFSCSPNPALKSSGLFYVILKSPRLSHDVAQWLSDNLDIGGYLLQIYNNKNNNDISQQIKTDQWTASKYLIPARNYIQILNKYNEEGLDIFSINLKTIKFRDEQLNRYSFIRSSRTSTVLIDWILNKHRECDVFHPDDLNACIGVIERENEKRHSENYYDYMNCGLPPMIVHHERLTDDDALCLKLNRIEIDYQNNIRVCSHGEVIGKVGDSISDLKARLLAYAIDDEKRKCPFNNLLAIKHKIDHSSKLTRNIISWIVAFANIEYLIMSARH